MSEVFFSCQRCCQPLRLHSTLEKITKEALMDLTRNATTTNKKKNSNEMVAKDKDINSVIDSDGEPSSSSSASLASSPKANEKGIVYKKIPSLRAKQSQSDNNNLVDGNLAVPGTSSAEISSSLLTGFDHSKLMEQDRKRRKGQDNRLQMQLFDILSDQSDIDHPLCEECADFVIDQMDSQLAVLEKEYKECVEYLSEIESLPVATDAEIEELTARLKTLQACQADKIEELKHLNREQRKLDDELARQTNELLSQKFEEDKYWQEYNSVKFSLFQSQEELETLENKSKAAKELYERLKKRNIFDAAFYIWIDNTTHCGCINGLRLGRPACANPPDWNEINAAWGQCALLLASMANKIGITFQRYKIVPYGNYSFIESAEDKTKQLPLYTSGGTFKFNLFHHKFDQAMLAFLDCLFQFGRETNKLSQFNLPYA